MKTILVDAIGTFVSEEGEIFKELHELLETYPNRKIVLTMAPDDLMEKWGLNNLPYDVWTSKLNPKKVDPQYYQQMLSHFGLEASEVVYFEHDPEAVKSAESVGITSHHYDEEKRDLVALKAFLDSSL